MTLTKQFPDVSVLIREKNRLKYNASLLFKDIYYTANSSDRKFYDKEFRIIHYELIAFIVVLLGTLFFVILN